MGEVNFHKDGRVTAHLNKDGKIIGVEVPEEILRITSIDRYPTSVTKEDNTKCPKGLKDCEKEIVLNEVKYILVAHYVGTRCVLDNVIIDEDTLELSYRHYKHVGRPTSHCMAYDPIHTRYMGSNSCVYCSLFEACTQ
jgi:hypothetical protein